MSDLPLFSGIDVDEQTVQIADYLKSLGAELKEDDLSSVINSCHVLAQLDSEAEIEMVLNSILSIVVIQPHDIVEKFTLDFADKVSSEQFSAKASGALIRVLSNLFHACRAPERTRYQFHVYCCLLKVAARSGLVRQVPSGLDQVKKWFDVWRVSIEQRRECLRLLHEALINGKQVEAPAKVMIELLGTYTTQTDAQNATADAKQCIRAAIADPATFIFDHLLSLRPVQALAKDKVHELLMIFVNGNFSNYLLFYEANKAFIEGLKLDHQENLHKMRILTLMSLGEKRNEITFADLSKHLGLPVGQELEVFIIRAVQSRMLKAKMDQMQERLVIGGVKHRTFDKPQWDQLGGRLEIWHDNLQQLKQHFAALPLQA